MRKVLKADRGMYICDTIDEALGVLVALSHKTMCVQDGENLYEVTNIRDVAVTITFNADIRKLDAQVKGEKA